MTESAESNRPTLVKPRSTWVITSKTSSVNPIEPLDQVYTHPRSTLGQRHGQTPFKHWCQWMSSGTFAAFSKFHLNSSKSTNMKVVQFVEEHNFHVDWHFKFWEEIGKKLGQPSASPVHRNIATFKVWQQFVKNPLRKTPYGLCKSSGSSHRSSLLAGTVGVAYIGAWAVLACPSLPAAACRSVHPGPPWAMPLNSTLPSILSPANTFGTSHRPPKNYPHCPLPFPIRWLAGARAPAATAALRRGPSRRQPLSPNQAPKSNHGRPWAPLLLSLGRTPVSPRQNFGRTAAGRPGGPNCESPVISRGSSAI
jgi:hypothetical protein